jgi:hypothetical protein
VTAASGERGCYRPLCVQRRNGRDFVFRFILDTPGQGIDWGMTQATDAPQGEQASTPPITRELGYNSRHTHTHVCLFYCFALPRARHICRRLSTRLRVLAQAPPSGAALGTHPVQQRRLSPIV